MLLKKKVLIFCLCILTLGIFNSSVSTAQQPILPIQKYEFKKAKDIEVEVLPKAVFEALVRINIDIPTRHEEIVRMARELFPPMAERPGKVIRFQLPSGRMLVPEECGEADIGLLFAALQNPDISDQTRDEVDGIIDASEPDLPLTYSSGHFKFYYTTTSPHPADNVTLADIQATAVILNHLWKRYVADFTTPKHYISDGKMMIDVRVYDITSYLGFTHSATNYIALDSAKVVKNRCKRQTISAHELFHRVQYAYGYITGTPNMSWIVEGSASWSQKYASPLVRDYMDRMSSGLNTPDKSLLARSYDSCHFWIFLRRFSATQTEAGEKEVVKKVWQTFKNSATKDAAAAKQAVHKLIHDKLAHSVYGSFDGGVTLWNRVNYNKDFLKGGLEDYPEDNIVKTSCNETYGPLPSVPKVAKIDVTNTTNWSKNDSVSAYGADYYELRLKPSANGKQVKITLDGDNAGNFSYQFSLTQVDKWKETSYPPEVTDYTYTKVIDLTKFDKIGVIVGGKDKGGNYSINVKVE